MEEMLKIRDINEEQVKLYGKYFLPLIKRTHDTMGENEAENGTDDVEDSEEVIPDKNKNIVSLLSDEEEYNSFDDTGTDEQSHYWAPPAEPQAFNAQCIFLPISISILRI